jgi:hypothetical protein
MPMADQADPALQSAKDSTGALVSRAATGRAALELALRVRDTLLSAGMSPNDVVVLMLCITAAYGLQHVHVDVA